MLYKKIPVTVFISLALVMGGCSTLKGKKADDAANQNYPQGQGVQDADTTGADTNALSEPMTQLTKITHKDKAYKTQTLLLVQTLTL